MTLLVPNADSTFRSLTQNRYQVTLIPGDGESILSPTVGQNPAFFYVFFFEIEC